MKNLFANLIPTCKTKTTEKPPKHLIEEIAQGRWYDESKVEGYSEEEIRKIEKLYNIEIKGIFKDFMLEMGRCDGGLLGDDPITLYRELWSVRTHIMYQASRCTDIFDILKINDLNKQVKIFNKPFIFAMEAETQFYYMNTGFPEPHTVFHYDENNETVEDTGDSFIDFMKYMVMDYGKYEPKQIICRGEMIQL